MNNQDIVQAIDAVTETVRNTQTNIAAVRIDKTASSLQTIASGATTLVDFGTVRFNHGTTLDAAISRITVAKKGIYAISGSLYRSGGTCTKFGIQVRVNGVGVVGTRFIPIPAGHNWITGEQNFDWELNVGDYVELFCYSEGGTCDIDVNPSNALQLHFVRPT